MGAPCPAPCSLTIRRPASASCRRWHGWICRLCRSAISAQARVGDPVVIAGAGGRKHSLAARIVSKQEYAGYWEYVLDEAIFTTPAHPNWGGTAVIGSGGELLGVGSLQLQQAQGSGSAGHLNMSVPIDLLKPILDDLLTMGRPESPAPTVARTLRHRS